MICEESMGHGCNQTLLRVETCAHHVLTGTYDKRIIKGLNCSYKQPFNLATLRKYFKILKSKIFRKDQSFINRWGGGGGVFSGGGSRKNITV